MTLGVQTPIWVLPKKRHCLDTIAPRSQTGTSNHDKLSIRPIHRAKQQTERKKSCLESAGRRGVVPVDVVDAIRLVVVARDH